LSGCIDTSRGKLATECRAYSLETKLCWRCWDLGHCRAARACLKMCSSTDIHSHQCMAASRCRGNVTGLSQYQRTHTMRANTQCFDHASPGGGAPQAGRPRNRGAMVLLGVLGLLAPCAAQTGGTPPCALSGTTYRCGNQQPPLTRPNYWWSTRVTTVMCDSVPFACCQTVPHLELVWLTHRIRLLSPVASAFGRPWATRSWPPGLLATFNTNRPVFALTVHPERLPLSCCRDRLVTVFGRLTRAALSRL
jgi:hypothetical protein